MPSEPPSASLPHNSRSGHSMLMRYGAAALAIVAAALLCAALDPLVEEESPFLLFTPAVMVAAWFGGLGPGLFATVLGGLVGDFFWVKPLYTLTIIHPHELFHTLVFYAVGGAISLMSRGLETARANAVAANRAKDGFLAVVSHELRNPLAPVMAAVSSLEDVAGLPAQARGDLATIRRNVALQARLIDDLLDANRLAHGKLLLRWDACDARRVIADALDVCRPEALAKGVDLRFAPDAARHHVRGDPARLQQVFWNLIRNAVKFTPPGGSVTVRAANDPADATLVVDVADTGIGIPRDDLARIFEPFEQGAGTVPQEAGGLGIGLALARALVRLHSGAIRADSAGPGQGATFTVKLPTIPAPAEAAAASPAPAPVPVEADDSTAPPAHHADRPPPPQADRRADAPTSILLVEDDPDTGPLMLRIMRRYGYEATLAPTAADALRASRDHHFDLIVSDLRLPDGSGADLLRQLRARDPVRAICVSGSGSDADLHESRAAGFERHFVKPVDLPALRDAIDGVLAE